MRETHVRTYTSSEKGFGFREGQSQRIKRILRRPKPFSTRGTWRCVVWAGGVHATGLPTGLLFLALSWYIALQCSGVYGSNRACVRGAEGGVAPLLRYPMLRGKNETRIEHSAQPKVDGVGWGGVFKVWHPLVHNYMHAGPGSGWANSPPSRNDRRQWGRPPSQSLAPRGQSQSR